MYLAEPFWLSFLDMGSPVFYSWNGTSANFKRPLAFKPKRHFNHCSIILNFCGKFSAASFCKLNFLVKNFYKNESDVVFTAVFIGGIYKGFTHFLKIVFV